MLSAIIPLITFYENISIHFLFIQSKNIGICQGTDDQKKLKDSLRKQRKAKGKSQMPGKGQLAVCTANYQHSVSIKLQPQLSFISVPSFPNKALQWHHRDQCGWTFLLKSEREAISPRAPSYPGFPCGGKPGLRSKEVNQPPSLGRRQNLNPSLPNAPRPKSASRH